jgi:hypothetical protein
VDTRKLLAVAAIPAVLTFGALGFAQQQGTVQQGGGNQVEDGD